MSRESVLAHGRAFEAGGFLSTCIVRRAGALTWNEDTGTNEPSWTTIYDGPCDIRFPSTTVSDVDAQAQLLTKQQPRLKLPVDGAGSAEVRTDDVAEITAHPHDPGRVGVEVRVAGEHTGTAIVSRRFPIELIT